MYSFSSHFIYKPITTVRDLYIGISDFTSSWVSVKRKISRHIEQVLNDKVVARLELLLVCETVYTPGPFRV